ncbi:ABC transporter permease [uncultured Rhodoblastus sp.]|uniref:ABC transporter permease n=1 Tax=uncultured Rhodoblastus sp. TaxID=543037 RepID=UPI0025DDE171|nr:ABC transporter permease [uncultured Rhodoblastus sp.]
MSKFDTAAPRFSVEKDGENTRIALSGAWTIAASRVLEQSAKALAEAAHGAAKVSIDFAGVTRLDTAGAWLIDKARTSIAAAGVAAEYAAVSQDQNTLLHEAAYAPPVVVKLPKLNPLVSLLAGFGAWTLDIVRQIVAGVAFLGELVIESSRTLFNPKLARPTSLVYHLETFSLRAVPIIVTINFLVGCIVEQQGIFQLKRFGAPIYAVDLIGVLVLRELGVLLTSIMIAGRSGSAITAEIGSMKMREEIDALRVMGMSPIDVLILPRLYALIIALPLLTFLGDMAALSGGLLTAWIYEGISPVAFANRLQDAIGLNTFLVGLIKAPFMALVIAIIASIEGFKVEGSAESLGRRVTDSVVNGIFMVIFVDGLFAIFFASIHY